MSKSGASAHWWQSFSFPNPESPAFSAQFRSSLINLKESNIAMRNSNKRILKDFLKEYIDKFVEAQYMNKITASSIKKKLGEQFEDLKSVSKSTIIWWLKKGFNCSYKKMTRKPEPALTPESLVKVLEVATIQQKLYSSRVEVIYVDEFSVNTRHHQFHCWSKRGRKGFLRIQK